ncbi:hypothetical protein L083_4061 [Actinoplanes sp. N902-109]|nr:hypothetical protein L083_4061 [Actinoplanes sp. N902-109]
MSAWRLAGRSRRRHHIASTPRHRRSAEDPAETGLHEMLRQRDELATEVEQKQLKRAFFLAAFAALAHPPSGVSYDRKRA